jgi:hypothetical protein
MGNRSAAFVRAWAIVKAGTVEMPVKGVSFGSRQEALRRLSGYDPVKVHAFLVPEQDNPADPKAIAVMVMVQGGRGIYRLGYVPREQTALARAMQDNRPSLKVIIGNINGAKIRLTA